MLVNKEEQVGLCLPSGGEISPVTLVPQEMASSTCKILNSIQGRLQRPPLPLYLRAPIINRRKPNPIRPNMSSENSYVPTIKV